MVTLVKIMISAAIVASFSWNAIADDTATKDRPTINNESQDSSTKDTTERRKGIHDHVKNKMTPEELKSMHNKVKENMGSKSADHGNATNDQSSKRRKGIHDHVNNKMTPDELQEMHSKVKENMGSKSAEHNKDNTAKKPAN